MSVQIGRPPNSKKVGLHYVVPLPVYMLHSVHRMRFKHLELLPRKWGKTITTRNSLYPIHKKNLMEEMSKLTNKGLKIEAKQMFGYLPIFCLNCEREGTPEFNEDTRTYTDGKTPTFRIHYNHNSHPKRCYVGTWKNGQTALKEGLDIRKMGINYWLRKNGTV